MTRETRLERDILQAIDDCNEQRPVTPGQLLQSVNEVDPGEYQEGEFYGCLRRMAEEGLISTPSQGQLTPGHMGGLTGLIRTTLPSPDQTRLDELSGD
jgi:hypothetical protein